MAEKRQQGTEEEEAPARSVNELEGDFGKITFTENVIRAIVHHAVEGIEGLGAVKGRLTDIVSIFGGRQKGIQIELGGEGIKVSMNVAVSYGKPIQEVARRIQETIKEELEQMTGLHVSGVDIFVQDVQPAGAEQQTEADGEGEEPEGEA